MGFFEDSEGMGRLKRQTEAIANSDGNDVCIGEHQLLRLLVLGSLGVLLAEKSDVLASTARP